ncbi:MAG: hypothetical protein ACKO3Q_04160, partial [Betaproteobacteria bacterium]
LTTGNDGPDRDPMRYVLSGSNFDLGWADPAWTQIATGQTGLSTERRASNTVTFTNAQSFKYYKLVLVDLRNAATAYGMQVSEVRLGNTLSSNAAVGGAVQLAELSLVTARSDAASPGVVPFGSGAGGALDGDRGTKYVNAAKAGSGLLTALQAPRVVNRIDFTSAKNEPGSDPTRFVLLGSNAPLAWDSTAWTQVASAATGLSAERGATSTVGFANSQSFQYYKLVFTELRSADAAAMQIAGVYLDGTLPAGQGFDHVSVSPNGQQMAALSNAGMVAISRDAGSNWTLVSAPTDDYTDVLVTNDGRVLLADRAGGGTPGNLRELAVDGRSWTALNLPSRNWQDLTVAGETLLGVTGRASGGASAGGIFQGVVSTLIDSVTASSGNVPSGEGAANVADGNSASKYLNRDKAGSGLVFTLSRADVVNSLQFTSANDAPERDPMTFTVFGSNGAADWSSAAWTQVGQGNTGLGTARRVEAAAVSVANITAYKHYKVVMTGLRNSATANAMQ